MRRLLELASLLVLAACGGEPEGLPAPVFDPKAPGPPEFPGGPLSEPFPWIVIPAGAAVAIASALLVRHRLRRRSAPRADRAATHAAAEPPHVRALLRLARLRSSQDTDLDELAAIVREYVRDRFDVPSLERTSEELVAVPQLAAHCAHLAAILSVCDAVKFARAAPSAEDGAEGLDRAEAFVRETA